MSRGDAFYCGRLFTLMERRWGGEILLCMYDRAFLAVRYDRFLQKSSGKGVDYLHTLCNDL